MSAFRVSPRPRWRSRRVVYPGLYAVFLLLTIVGCTDRLILYPSTDPLKIGGIERRQVAVPQRDPVEAWVAQSPGAKSAEPEAFVLAFVGNADRGERMAAYVAEDWN